MPTKRKPNLSLKRPKWRKRNESHFDTSHGRTFKDAEMTSVQQTLKRTEEKASPSFMAIPLASKRKLSPFKSPLTKIMIPNLPAVGKSPMMKRFKVTSNRAKVSPSFIAIPLAGKRNFSPFKSPLTKIKIPMSPAFRKSPIMKRLKVTSARALFTAQDDVSRSAQRIKEESFDLTDSQNTLPDLQDNFSERTESVIGNLKPSAPDTNEILVDSLNTEYKDDFRELKALLPTVVEKLCKEGFDDALISFIKQTASDAFPLNNIAFLLWVDVVRWFNCSSTTLMRYSEDTKKFWKVGWRIFRGRFINFMSGYKNDSQVVLGYK